MDKYQFPIWIEYIRVLGAPIVALLAAIVAGFFARAQWHTARQKLIVDLFERRITAYQAINAAVGRISVEGMHNVQINHRYDLIVAVDRAKFLFGYEVRSFLKDSVDVVNRLGRLEKIIQAELDDVKLAKFTEEEDKLNIKFAKFHDDFQTLVEPYLLLDDKKPH